MATAAPTLRPPATMTARMVVMMTPGDKRAVEDRARALDMTPSELIRRASQAYEPGNDDAMLEAFVEEFAANNQAMHQTLSAALDRLDAKLAEVDAIRAARR